MPADIIDYEIIGNDLQAVIVTLDPGEAVMGEAGAMMFMEDGIQMATQLSMKENPGGIFGKLFEAGKRMVTGDSFFITMFANQASQRRQMAFAAPYPGHIIPMELADFGGELLCQKDSFLCAARGVEVDIAFTKKIGAGLFGGEGFILQRLRAPSGNGLAIVHAGGTVLPRTLRAGESLRVDTGCLVAFERSVQYDIKFVGGVKNVLFGGEGLFYTTLTGPGRVWLQTLPFSRLADRIVSSAPRHGGRSSEEGSVLGSLGRLVGGD